MISNLGRVGFVVKDEFISGTTYERLDVVRFGSGTYICKASSTTVSPDTGADWFLAARDGLTGPVGRPGDSGAAGRDGVDGVTQPVSIFIRTSVAVTEHMAVSVGARADNLLEIPAIGITKHAAEADSVVEVVPVGELGGFTGLTPGATLYLGTEGAITFIEPDIGIIQQIGFAISDTTILVALSHGVQVPLGGGAGGGIVTPTAIVRANIANTRVVPVLDNAADQLVADDPYRAGLIVVNETDGDLFLLFGDGFADYFNFSVKIPNYCTLDLGLDEYTGRISYCANGVGSLKITEFSIDTALIPPIIGGDLVLAEDITFTPTADLGSTTVQDAILEVYTQLNGVLGSVVTVPINETIPVGSLPEIPFTKLTGTPKSLFGYGIEDQVVTLNLDGFIDIGYIPKIGWDWVSFGVPTLAADFGFTDVVHSVAGRSGSVELVADDISQGVFSVDRIPDITWSKISNPPSTLSELGVTDGVHLQTVNAVPNTLVDGRGNLRSLPIHDITTAAYTIRAVDNGCTLWVKGGNINIPAHVMEPGNTVLVLNTSSTPVSVDCTLVNAFIAGVGALRNVLTIAPKGLVSLIFYDTDSLVVSGDVS